MKKERGNKKKIEIKEERKGGRKRREEIRQRNTP